MIADAIRSLVNARDLELECTRFLHEALLVSVLMYGSKTMLWKKEISRTRAEEMDNLRGLLSIRIMDRVPNAQIRELRRVKKWLYERIDEGILRWFGPVEKMERDRTAKRVYVEECAGSHSVGSLWKRGIDTVIEMFQEKRFGCQVSRENGAG